MGFIFICLHINSQNEKYYLFTNLKQEKQTKKKSYTEHCSKQAFEYLDKKGNKMKC